ncbi:MAG: ferrous iron transporter B, partial [Muribaculaceae bacterium]|nr:ferrous iron transporter B [Muribaculaceae bacterium]
LKEWIEVEDKKLHITPVENNEPEEIEDFRKDRIINVALVGNPNCGKTSLFNIVSGAHERVGNYAGVTVGAKAGTMKYKGYLFNIVDLPGTYSLSAYSPEELYVMRYLRDETPDVIVNVVVASNLERNLYLTTELIEMNRSMVIALNMYDELEKHHISLDYDCLGKMLGVPMIPTQASSGWGVDKLLDTIIDVYELRNPDTRHIHIRMRPEVETSVTKLKDAFKRSTDITHKFAPRFLAIKMLERDPEIENLLSNYPGYPDWENIRDDESRKIETKLEDDANSIISAEKYGFIQGALAETLSGPELKKEQTTKIIDTFVTNKLFGFPIFILVMWLMFWATFRIGAYPMEWIESFVSWVSNLIGKFL